MELWAVGLILYLFGYLATLAIWARWDYGCSRTFHVVVSLVWPVWVVALSVDHTMGWIRNRGM